MPHRHSLALLALLAHSATAQVIVDGREAEYDSLTATVLATVPRTAFGSDYTARISLADGWTEARVDGRSADGSDHHFGTLSAATACRLTATRADGTQVERRLMFTFLPVMRLDGQPGYEAAPARLTLHEPGQTDLSLTASVKWRGGSTNTPDKHKRNYKIKLTGDGGKADRSLLSLRDDDSWILDAGQADLSRVRNRVTTELWADAAMRPYYAAEEPEAMTCVRGHAIELFLGQSYAGVYHLTECPDRKQFKVKKVKDGKIRGCLWKTGGYNCEMMTAPLTSWDNCSDTLGPTIEIKYPDTSDIRPTDHGTLARAITFVATATDREFAAHVGEYFDLPALADYWLLVLVANGVDSTAKNMLWAVHDQTEDRRLTPGVWDLDATFGQNWDNDPARYRSTETRPDNPTACNLRLITRLLDSPATGFPTLLRWRWSCLKDGPYSTAALRERFARKFDELRLSGASAREEARWSGDSDICGLPLSLDDEELYIADWTQARHDWLEALFAAPASAIDPLPGAGPQAVRRTSPTRLTRGRMVWDLLGRRWR